MPSPTRPARMRATRATGSGVPPANPVGCAVSTVVLMGRPLGVRRRCAAEPDPAGTAAAQDAHGLLTFGPGLPSFRLAVRRGTPPRPGRPVGTGHPAGAAAPR